MSDYPPISVLMPVYNAGIFLRDSIESILNQSFSNFEFVIINDGSTDDSEEIIKSYADSRIIYVKNPVNLKLIKTLNKGIDICRGKYIVRMDADDISYPERLSRQFAFMEANPEVGLCGCNFESTGLKKMTSQLELDDQKIKLKLLHECHYQHPTMIIRRSILKDNNIYFDRDFLHVEDYELWARLISYCNYANIPEVLLKYRDHESNVTNTYSPIQKENSLLVRRKLFEMVGLKANAVELDLYQNCAYHNYPKDIEDIKLLDNLLNRMIIANRKSELFTEDCFEDYIAKMWWNLLYNSTAQGSQILQLYKQSNMMKLARVKTASFLRFWVKAAIKK
ncbi:MAG: glycosyltransferase [Bacteroidetes bacterium]|nr:glycosyltransferase [Bacteroidota bacterium]